jgi:hypothetical protein
MWLMSLLLKRSTSGKGGILVEDMIQKSHLGLGLGKSRANMGVTIALCRH